MPTPTRPLRVYLFIEHYPNPYKPWIDTQVVQMLRAGHDVRIFAMGAYTSTLHDEVRENDLLARTSYLPGTLRGLKAHGVRLVLRLLSSPRQQAHRVSAAVRGTSSPKQQLLVASRTLCLPDVEPDVCYIHNLVSAAVLTFLHRLYPKTRVCLYFHGGEVGGQPKVQDDRRVFASVDAVITVRALRPSRRWNEAATRPESRWYRSDFTCRRTPRQRTGRIGRVVKCASFRSGA